MFFVDKIKAIQNRINISIRQRLTKEFQKKLTENVTFS